MTGIMIVTGASRGIGAAIARKAAVSGYAVAVNYHRSAAAAEAVVADILTAGGRAVALCADISRSEEAARLFAEVDRELGAPDVLVNNAGMIGAPTPIEAASAAHLADVFAANVLSMFFCCREATLRMSCRRGGNGGTIINMSSVAARHGGLPNEAHYAASKGAIDSLTLALAKELGPQGIRVNAVRPGLIDTAIHDAHGGRAAIDALAPGVPLGRAGTAEEVADSVMWLVSSAAAYVHGALVDVSGGR
ncbi:NAD(P)-dependent dehydrogenase (short-subunit alcohol dehydrogenase family) [Bradyrhizobium algeriense]|uniref:NAD(P)-dependent dehydrogenase (Short-subunit alcohol dehydrogenase family) n=1 Tax=Bradyrhizobium algeriense TaxID=634784 RepID=A0ABU8BGL5_9BRAD